MSDRSGPHGLAARAFGQDIRSEFRLDPDIAFLNNGSFGATPRRVHEFAEDVRRRLERQPVQFFRETYPALLEASVERVAAFVGARMRDIAPVENATTGANAVIRSLEFEPGDELLTTTHVYGAVRQTLKYVASRSGAAVIEVEVPFPVSDEDQIVEAITRRFTPRTRLLVIDHVTSPTAIVFPAARLAAGAKARGIPVLVDGAHAPGMLDLDVPSVGADWYVGNLHKWLFAPKSCGFLWAAPEAQAKIHPVVISHGYGGGLHAEFGWTGTRDMSPWLSIPEALAFVEAIGIDLIRAHNHALACEAAKMISEAWGTPVGAPPSMFGSMAPIALPPRGPFADAPPTLESRVSIQDYLWKQHRVEVPIMPFAGRLWARISAQIYNHIGDYRRLSDALSA